VNEPIPVPPRPDTLLVPPPLVPPPLGRATWDWWEVLLAVLVAWFIGGLVSLPLVILLEPDASGPIDGASLFIGIVSNVVTLGALVLWLRSMHPGWVTVLGWPARGAWAKEIGVGALLGVAVRLASGIVAAVVVAILRGASDEAVRLPEQVSSDLTGWGLISFAIFAVIAAPVLEEFVFRGLLFRSIADRHGFWPGALASGLAFGAFHLLTPGSQLDVLALGITHVGTGIGLAWIYQRRRNLLAPIAGHAVFNLIAVVAIVAGVEV
jgi:membrane protease YdiL (CAAX protease family)